MVKREESLIVTQPMASPGPRCPTRPLKLESRVCPSAVETHDLKIVNFAEAS